MLVDCLEWALDPTRALATSEWLTLAHFEKGLSIWNGVIETSGGAANRFPGWEFQTLFLYWVVLKGKAPP